MKQTNLLLLLFIIFVPHYLFCRSVVYNFRIAQITKEHTFDSTQALKNTPIGKNTTMGLVFDEISKKRYDDIHTNFAGLMTTYIYTQGPIFLRGDFSFAGINQRSSMRSFSDVQSDDLLFTLGRNFKPQESIQVTLSALFGVPTHQIFALLKPELGFGQFGIGAQLDNAYNFNPINSLILGGRYVYFIPRHAYDKECKRFMFTNGNLIDFLIASKNVWGKHGLELGFTPRFAFGSKIFPYLKDATDKVNYIRTSWYAVYQYKCMIGNTVNRFLLNIASGFDVAPKKWGHQYIVFLWGAWTIRF